MFIKYSYLLNNYFNYILYFFNIKMTDTIMLEKKTKRMGIGDWGLGIGNWELGTITKNQTPITKHQNPKLIIKIN